MLKSFSKYEKYTSKIINNDLRIKNNSVVFYFNKIDKNTARRIKKPGMIYFETMQLKCKPKYNIHSRRTIKELATSVIETFSLA